MRTRMTLTKGLKCAITPGAFLVNKAGHKQNVAQCEVNESFTKLFSASNFNWLKEFNL